MLARLARVLPRFREDTPPASKTIHEHPLSLRCAWGRMWRSSPKRHSFFARLPAAPAALAARRSCCSSFPNTRSFGAG